MTSWEELDDLAEDENQEDPTLLDDHDKAQILLDIQSRGGLDKYKSIRYLYPNNKELYGAPGSKHRKSITNLLSYWKRVSPLQRKAIFHKLEAKAISLNLKPSTPTQPEQEPETETMQTRSNKQASQPQSAGQQSTMKQGTAMLCSFDDVCKFLVVYHLFFVLFVQFNVATKIARRQFFLGIIAGAPAIPCCPSFDSFALLLTYFS